MKNKKFIKHTGIVVPINFSNIDTDIIIPKQFLQEITRNGFGKYLFYDWRYIDGKEKKINLDFNLNKKEFLHASILLTSDNFGCGSSREHALWALKDYGFKVIIASSFADIFYSNSINNQILPIVLNKKIINNLFDIVFKNPGIAFEINLKKLKITIYDNINLSLSFKMNNCDYERILYGLDNISITLNMQKEIIKWEEKNKL